MSFLRSNYKFGRDFCTSGNAVGQLFPNILVTTRKGDAPLYALLNNKPTVLVCQPGISLPHYWQPEILEKWKATPGLPGCGKQVDEYAARHQQFKELDRNVVVLVTQRSAEQLAEIKEKKNLPFEVFSLTPESLKDLQKLGFPTDIFDGTSQLSRVTYLLDDICRITQKFDRRDAEVGATVCAGSDAAETLEYVKAEVEQQMSLEQDRVSSLGLR